MAESPDPSGSPGPKREQWGTKIGFVFAAAGSAVGLGNIWKFPYETGNHGGAAYVLIYLVFVILLGLPIMMSELLIGRRTRKDPVGAFKTMFEGKSWTWVGYLGVLSGFFILSFYSVVGGWTLGYIIKSIQGVVSSIKDVSVAKATFDNFAASPLEALGYHFLFISFCVLIVIWGIKNGIERWSKFLMPLLFVLLFVLIVKGFTMEGGMKGVKFLLYPDFSLIRPGSIKSALGHSFFTLSLGMGAMITYGSYLSKKDNILSSGTYIVGLDTLIAILAGLAIFPAVFAMNMPPSGGPGLIFHVIPAVFGNMEYGMVFSIIFFTLLFIAALTSGMSLLEVVAAYIIDEKGWKRPKAVIIFGIIIFILGIPSALSFGPIEEVKIFFGQNFFGFMEKLTAIYMLPIGGFFIAIALAWSFGTKNAVQELNEDPKVGFIKKAWMFILKYISPTVLLIFFTFTILEMIFPEFFKEFFK
ncbi:MAG: sodium-dependent transporter [bacterium]|nr:sodium-dependent transporter [bacterium]